MAQIPLIDDAYINEIIKSNGPYNPLLIKTQGAKMRELIKLLRDRMEQGDTGVVRTTGDQNISGTKTFTLVKAEGISVNNLANPDLSTVISTVNGIETKLLNLSAGAFAVQVSSAGLSALRTQTLQDKSGVIALTDDIQNERVHLIAGTGISLNGTYPDITINTTGIDATPDATTLIRGKIRLSGDLAGNADAPTVPGLAGKESLTNKSTDVNLGNSNSLYPSQNAVKSYIDNAGFEQLSNKQNSLTIDGTGVKYPTVDAVNASFTTLFPQGELGQILRNGESGDNSYIPYDNVIEGSYITTDAELATAKGQIISKAEIFNTWKRYAIGGNPDKPQAQDTIKTGKIPMIADQTNSWVYEAANDIIRSTFNAGSHIGFVSNKPLMNYIHRTTLSVTSNTGTPDNDKIGLVIAFTEDANDMVTNEAYGLNPANFSWPIDVTSPTIPNQHHLIVYRNRNGINNSYTVMYNFNNIGSIVIKEGSNLGVWGTANNWPGVEVDIEVLREGDTITIRTTDFSDAPGGKGVLRFPITINLNDYPELLKFKGPQRYGYMVQSQINATYKNISINDGINEIYDLRDGSIWALNSNNDYEISSDRNVFNELLPKSIVFNPITKKFIYVSKLNKWEIINNSTDLAPYQLLSQKGQPNGYAVLDSDGLVPFSQLKQSIANEANMLVARGALGEIFAHNGNFSGYLNLGIGPTIKFGIEDGASFGVGSLGISTSGLPLAVGKTQSTINVGTYDMIRFGWHVGVAGNAPVRTSIATKVTATSSDYGLAFLTSSGAGTPTEKLVINHNGHLSLNTAPVISAGTYDIITRNNSTGIIEKIPSTVLDGNVKLTGEQTINGKKTFTANTFFEGINILGTDISSRFRYAPGIQAGSGAIATFDTGGYMTSSPSVFADFRGMKIGSTIWNSAAVLNVESKTKGFLMPFMTASERTAINLIGLEYGPMGLQVYQTDGAYGNYTWHGSTLGWKRVITEEMLPGLIDLSSFELLSNKSTSQLLGTSNTLYPTQNAVKGYVDGLFTNVVNTTGNQTGIAGNKSFTGAASFIGLTSTAGLTSSGGNFSASGTQGSLSFTSGLFFTNTLGTHAQIRFDDLSPTKMRGRLVLNKRDGGNISGFAITPPLNGDSGGDYALPDNGGAPATLALRQDINNYYGSGNGSSTSIVIPHFKANINSGSDIIITPRNSASAGYSYVELDATNITIVYPIAPPSGTDNLHYTILIMP